MKLNKILPLICWACSFTTYGQQGASGFISSSERYLYPVKPGQPGSLAGNMGELRSTHFHGGIDVRTENRIGLDVHASKSGYISRVAMNPSSYGNVIYIKHPDGNTTLYGHLDHFIEPLASYVLAQQYKQKTFTIDLVLEENQFPVKRGDVIAISGNTGGSGGPHLHFEIRDPKNFLMNPLLFKFDEINDPMPPIVEKVAFVTLDENSRINDKFGRFEFYAYRSGNNYSIASPILAHGNIGVEILAKDKFLPRDQFYGGVNYIDVNVNGAPYFKQAIERIDASEPRGIFTLIDYQVFRKTGQRFYKLFQEDGNTLPFYAASPTNGKIHVDEKKETRVDITLRDPFLNSTKVSFSFKPSPLIKDVRALGTAPRNTLVNINENIMTIDAKSCGNKEIVVYRHDNLFPTQPAYSNASESVYLLDLRKLLPDSIVVCSETIITNLITTIPSGIEYRYFSDFADITFPVEALYDTLYLNASRSADGSIFTIGERNIPISKAITVTYKPQIEYARDSRLAVYRKTGNSYSYLGGEWANRQVTFSTRELGHFTILTDVDPPTIRSLGITSYRARLKIWDGLSGIDSYTATLNGEWLLMQYDAKTSTIWSQQQDATQPLKGEFVLTVKDRVGNTETFSTEIK